MFVYICQPEPEEHLSASLIIRVQGAMNYAHKKVLTSMEQWNERIDKLSCMNALQLWEYWDELFLSPGSPQSTLCSTSQVNQAKEPRPKESHFYSLLY